MYVKGHSRSLKILPSETLSNYSYSRSIVTMAISSAVLQVFCVKEWPDLKISVSSHSRSHKMAWFDTPCTTLYWSAIVTKRLSCTIFNLFYVE